MLLTAAVFFACLMCLSLCPFEVSAKSSDHVVRVGFFSFDGYHMTDSLGKRSGYGYEYLQQMKNYTDWTFEYVGYDKGWGEMQDMLQNGQIDLLSSAQKTPEREAVFAFSDLPIGTSHTIFTVKAGNTKYQAGDYRNFNGMYVGMLEGNSRNQSFADFAQTSGFTYNTVLYQDLPTLTQALQDNQVDAIVTSDLRNIKNEWILAEFDPSSFYIMVRKDDTELIQEVNYALEQLRLYKPNLQTELAIRYYKPDSGAAISFTAEERAYLKELNKNGAILQAIVNPDRAPISYFENGAAKGIIPEIIAQISRQTGLKINIKETLNRQDYYKAIQNGSVAIMPDAGYDLNEAETEGFKLTDPYLTATTSAITEKSFEGTPTKIALVKYSDIAANFIDAYGTSNVVFFNTINDCIQAVRTKQADAAYVYTYSAQKIIAEDERNELKSSLVPGLSTEYAIAVAGTEDIRLRTILDKAVNNLNSDTVDQIVLTNTDFGERSVTPIGFLYDNTELVVYGVLFVLAVALLVILNLRKTALKEAQYNKDLTEANEKLLRASTAKSDFLSRMSHDIRTPLNAIIGLSDLAKESDSKEDMRADLHEITISGQYLLSIINDVLDMSKIENKALVLNERVVNLPKFIEETTAIVLPSIKQKHIHFTFKQENINAESMYFDETHVRQAIVNLLSNAIKFTPDGGEVSVSLEILERREDCVRSRVIVADTGIGMSEDFLPKLFTPFEQEDARNDAKRQGTGLGLSIVKSIVTLMNGTVSVESEKGKGSRFIIEWDVKTVPKALVPQDQTASDAQPSSPASLAGRRVLLAEDQPINAMIAERLLAKEDVSTEVAENGKEAVRLFSEAAPGYYDAVLMDIRMPEMDGLEAARTIRGLNTADAKTVPIIAMTANAFDEDVQKSMAAGMNAHLSKPIEPQRLYETLAGLIKPKL